MKINKNSHAKRIRPEELIDREATINERKIRSKTKIVITRLVVMAIGRTHYGRKPELLSDTFQRESTKQNEKFNIYFATIKFQSRRVCRCGLSSVTR